MTARRKSKTAEAEEPPASSSSSSSSSPSSPSPISAMATTDLHHILPQIDVTDHSNNLIDDVNTSINGFSSTPHRLGVPFFTPYPLQDSPPATPPRTSPALSLSSESQTEQQWWTGQYDFAAKIILLGDYGVGKTTLLKTLGCVKNLSWCRCICFRPNEYVEMECIKNEKRVLIRIMDTGGQERFRSMTSSYFRGAHGCLLTFNVTNEDSFNNIINWFNDLSLYAAPNDTVHAISSLVVGTVTSRHSQRLVTAERAFRLAESLNLTYCETQVQDEQMVLFILTRLVNNVIVNRARRQSLAITIMPSLKDGVEGKKKRWKCCQSS